MKTSIYPASSYLPWESLRKMRKSLGITQAQLANGIITQATLSQIESGRVMPAESVLYRLFSRLNVNAQEWIVKWEPYRHRQAERETLWRLFLRMNRDTFEDAYLDEMQCQSTAFDHALECFRTVIETSSLLTPVESSVYRAYSFALGHKWRLVEQELWDMWKRFGEYFPTLKKGANARQIPQRRNQESDTQRRSRELTKKERSRLLVVEAQTQHILARGLDRISAAEYWCAVAKERVLDTRELPACKSDDSHSMV